MHAVAGCCYPFAAVCICIITGKAVNKVLLCVWYNFNPVFARNSCWTYNVSSKGSSVWCLRNPQTSPSTVQPQSMPARRRMVGTLAMTVCPSHLFLCTFLSSYVGSLLIAVLTLRITPESYQRLGPGVVAPKPKKSSDRSKMRSQPCVAIGEMLRG